MENLFVDRVMNFTLSLFLRLTGRHTIVQTLLVIIAIVINKHIELNRQNLTQSLDGGLYC